MEQARYCTKDIPQARAVLDATFNGQDEQISEAWAAIVNAEIDNEAAATGWQLSHDGATQAAGPPAGLGGTEELIRRIAGLEARVAALELNQSGQPSR